MENNDIEQTVKREKAQRARNRFFVVMIFICLALIAAITYEIIFLVNK